MIKAQDLLSYRPFLEELARKLVHDPSEADDLVQESWLAALESPPQHDKNLRGWMKTVLRSKWMNRERARRRRAFHEASRDLELTEPATADLVVERAVSRKLAEALDALTPIYRSVMELRYFEGMAPREIAVELRVPVETVRTRSKRAIDALRLHMDAEHGGDRNAWSVALMSASSRLPKSVSTKSSIVGIYIAGPLLLASLAGIAVLIASETPDHSALEALFRSSVARTSEPEPALAEIPLIKRGEMVGEETLRIAADSVEPVAQGLPALGVLTYFDGKPVAGATIWASNQSDPYAQKPVATTDIAGQFEIEAIASDSWIGARFKNLRTHLTYMGGSDRLRSSSYHLAFRRNHSGDLNLSVSDGKGQALAGATVSIRYLRLGEALFHSDGKLSMTAPSLEFICDAEGRLQVSELHSKNYTLCVSAPGLAPFTREVRDAWTEELKVCLSLEARGAEDGRRPTHRGKIVDANGLGLAGWHVSSGAATELNPGLTQLVAQAPQLEWSVTDEAGLFEFKLGLGAGILRAWPNAAVEQAPKLWRSFSSGSMEEVTLVADELRAGPDTLTSSLEGYLEDASGSVLPGALLILSSSAFDQPLQIEPDASTGHFEIRDLPAARVAISVWIPGQAPQAGLSEFDLEAGERTWLGQLVLPGHERVDLTLLDVSGNPLQGIIATIKREGYHLKLREGSGLQGDLLAYQGRCELSLSPGEYRLNVFSQNAAHLERKIVVVPGAANDFEFRSIAPGLAPAFEVHLPEALSRATKLHVIATKLHGEQHVEETLYLPAHKTVLRVDLKPLAPGQYDLCVFYEASEGKFLASTELTILANGPLDLEPVVLVAKESQF
ncbi:MAG: RNA polymerase sigma-70 factor (ECF subfamily) [Planctomycetota bacterium]|jgi:RNA polymerase sigma-70 factor (ECF subfamily)